MLKIVKFQKFKTALLWGLFRRKYRKSLEKFKSDLREEQRFEASAPIGFHVNQKTTKNVKNQKLKILKIQNSSFVSTTETKIQKKFDMI